MKLSACMIAKNEEKNIAKCIESYKDVVTEVIVVDTGSTDKTAEIARSLGAKVFHYTWNNNFAEAKNFAIDRAKGDWIIFLDADEYFANDTAKNIPRIIKNLDKSFDTIASKMVNVDYANGKMLDEVTHVRIFRRNKHIRYVNPIHEMLLNREKNKNLKAFLADAKDLIIYHTGYSLSNRREKAERNLALLLLELDKAAEKPAIYQYISDCYFGMEDWEKAIEYARLFIASGAKFIGYNVKPHQNIIDAMLRLRCNVEDIRAEIDTGIKKFPKNPSFRFYLANLLYDLKKYDAAIAEYQNTLELQENYDDIEINSIPPNIYYIYYYMGIIAEYRNEYENAFNCFLNSLQREKYQADCFNRLMFIIKDLPTQDIILLLNGLYNTDNEADLEFLANQLILHRLPIVLAYYVNIRLKKFGKEDVMVLYMLLANGQYAKTFGVGLECYASEPDNKVLELLFVLAGILSGNEEYLAEVKARVCTPLRKIADALSCGVCVTFTVDDNRYFLDIFKQILIFGSQDYIKRTLELKRYFDSKIYVELGNILLKFRNYRESIGLYKEYLDLAGMETDSQAGGFFNIACCYYKLNDYSTAVDFFLRAYEKGYRSNDIYQFLRWSLKFLGGTPKQVASILGDNLQLIYED